MAVGDDAKTAWWSLCPTAEEGHYSRTEHHEPNRIGQLRVRRMQHVRVEQEFVGHKLNDECVEHDFRA